MIRVIISTEICFEHDANLLFLFQTIRCEISNFVAQIDFFSSPYFSNRYFNEMTFIKMIIKLQLFALL